METLDAATASLLLENPALNTEGYSTEELEAAANGTPLPEPEPIATPPVASTDEDINKLIIENPDLAVPPVEEAPVASNQQEIAIDQNSDLTAQSLYNTPNSQNPFNLRKQFSKFNAKTAAWFLEYFAKDENSKLLPIAARSRQNQADIEKQETDYLKMANDIFEGIGQVETDDNGEDTGRRIYTRVLVEKDAQGNPTGSLVEEDFVVPKPNEWGLDQLNRILRVSMVDLTEAVAGLTRGDISDDTGKYPLGTPEEDKNLNQRVPNQEISSGEQILADLLSLAVPATTAIKGSRLGLNLLKRATTLDRTAKVGGLGNFTSAVVGASLAETLMADDAQTGGFFMQPETLQKWFGEQGIGSMSDKNAKDYALMLDGLLINGAMDGLLTVGSKVIYPFFSRKGKDVVSLGNIKLFKNKVQNGQVLEVVKFLDPDAFVPNDTTGKIAARNLKKLSEVLNNNAVTNIRIGDFETTIPASTTQALYTGAEAYIRETRQYKIAKIGKENWEEYVEKESDLMFSKMVALMRSNRNIEGAEAGEVTMLNAMGQAITDAGAEKAGEVGYESASASAQGTAGKLVKQWDSEIKKLQGEVVIEEDFVTASKVDVDTVVETDPNFIDLEFLYDNSTAISERMRKVRDSFTNSKLFPEYKAQKTAMDAAFAAIPNDPIGPEAAQALIDAVNDAASANTRLSTKELRGVVKRNIKRLYNEVQPRALGEDLDGDMIFESDDFGEIADRIGQIGFRDLYNLRASLNNDITNGPPELRGIYIALKKNISSGVIENGVPQGQLAFVKKSGNPETAAAAEYADELYQNFDNRWRKVDALSEISNSFKKRLDNENLVPSRVSPNGRNPVDSEQAFTNYTQKALADEGGGLARTLSETIENVLTTTGITDVSVSGGINSDVSSMFKEVVMYDLMKTVIPQVKGSKLTADQFNVIIQPSLNRLRSTGNVEMALELEEMIASVRKRGEGFGNELFDGEVLLDEAKKNLEVAENNILQTLVTKIPRRVEDGVPEAMVVVGNPKEQISKILLNNDDNAIKGLLDEIDLMKLPDGSPNLVEQRMARVALQSVALDTVGNRIFGSSIGAIKGGKGQRRIKLGELDRLTDSEATGLFKSLDLIFPEGTGDQATENIREGLFQTLSTLYDASLATNVRAATVGSDTFGRTSQALQTRDAVSTGILLVAGYMNPTAAMLRRLASEPLEGLKSIEFETSQAAMATIISDPQGFAKLVDQLRGAQNISAVKKATKAFVNQAYLTGKYEFRVREEEDSEEEYGNFLQKLLGSDLYEGALPRWLTGVE